MKNQAMHRVDWMNLASVKAYALTLGPGQTVYQKPGRPNFNITHTARADILAGCTIYLQT